MDKSVPIKWNQKVGITIPISDKIDFKLNIIGLDKEKHFILIKGPLPKMTLLS